MSNTYTIAYTADLIWACEIDGTDMDHAFDVLDERASVVVPRSEVKIESGLTLTDDGDEGEVVFAAGAHTGHLTAVDGTEYRYAVRKPITYLVRPAVGYYDTGYRDALAAADDINQRLAAQGYSGGRTRVEDEIASCDPRIAADLRVEQQ